MQGNQCNIKSKERNQTVHKLQWTIFRDMIPHSSSRSRNKDQSCGSRSNAVVLSSDNGTASSSCMAGKPLKIICLTAIWYILCTTWTKHVAQNWQCKGKKKSYCCTQNNTTRDVIMHYRQQQTQSSHFTQRMLTLWLVTNFIQNNRTTRIFFLNALLQCNLKCTMYCQFAARDVHFTWHLSMLVYMQANPYRNVKRYRNVWLQVLKMCPKHTIHFQRCKIVFIFTLTRKFLVM